MSPAVSERPALRGVRFTAALEAPDWRSEVARRTGKMQRRSRKPFLSFDDALLLVGLLVVMGCVVYVFLLARSMARKDNAGLRAWLPTATQTMPQRLQFLSCQVSHLAGFKGASESSGESARQRRLGAAALRGVRFPAALEAPGSDDRTHIRTSLWNRHVK